MKSSVFKCVMLVLLLPLQGLAEDIDLFIGVPPQADGKPNVLIILDNTANWNTAFTNETQALRDVFFNMDPNGFNVGLMMFGESPNLGYVRAAIRDMSTSITFNGATEGDVDGDGDVEPYTLNYLYGKMIEAFDVSGDRGNARTLARTFSEAHAYLTGSDAVDTSRNSGYGKNDVRDYFENTDSGEQFTNAVHALEGNAFDDDRDSEYNDPPEAGVCANTYVIYIGNTVSSGNVTKDNTARNRAAGTDLSAVGGNTTQITDGFTYTSHQDNFADEWARYMHDEMGVIFYAVDVDPTDYPGGHANGMGNSDLLRSLSQGVGGGKYYRIDSDDPDRVKVTLEEIFSEIQAENSVFASVALPASTTGNSLFLNQVFIGLFRPDPSAYPLWPGNLKQYQLGLVTSGDFSTIRLLDSQGLQAINPSTGFVTECAESYWTPTPSVSDDYWAFAPQGLCPPATESFPSEADSPDGPYVEKGAQSYVTRTTYAAAPLSRTVYTCDYAVTDCDDLIDFDTTEITGTTYEGRFGADDADDLDDIVEWALGRDLEDDNADMDDDEIRPYIHGDVIHSRPVAINYGTDESPSVAVYYGANDGTLRAINGNQTGNLRGFSPGEELWAFIPPEYFDQIKRVKENTEVIKFPASGPDSSGRPGSPKPYGMDGPIIAYKGDVDPVGDNDAADTLSDQKLIFAGMRRGGRSLYAFDVTDPNDPDLLWKGGCLGTDCADPNDPSDDPTWADIGQTWSPPNIAHRVGEVNPVLIMGGGYDTCEDTDNGTSGANHACGGGSTGDHIYVIDAYDGSLLKEFDTLRAVPGAVTVVPIADPTHANPTPAIQYGYAADTGGNVYRISAASGAPLSTGGATEDIDDWELTRIASFGCGDEDADADESCTANRKFLFGPDVVRKPAGGVIFRILIGSGDREKPLTSYSATTDVQNYFYSFVDDPTNSDWLTDVTTDCGDDIICMEVLASVSRSVTTVDALADIDSMPYGYEVALSPEEQVVTGALVVGDVANFSTHIPYDPNDDVDGDVCVNKLGAATTYNIDFEDAGGDLIDIYTGGLVPTPVAGKVLICDGDNCAEVPFCIGCGGENSPIGGGTVGTGSGFEQAKGRVYWNIEQ